MREIILMVHISLDGFVAGPKGDLDWFEAGEENLEFVGSLTGDADAALFGRISYELLNKYWPTAKDRRNATKGEIKYSNWYNSAKKIVVSKTMYQQIENNTIVVNENIPGKIINIKKEAGKNIIIFGSPSVAQLLMQHNLVDSYWIFINPVIFGKGIPLFSEMQDKIKLKFLSEKNFLNGEIALNYKTNK